MILRFDTTVGYEISPKTLRWSVSVTQKIIHISIHLSVQSKEKNVTVLGADVFTV